MATPKKADGITPDQQVEIGLMQSIDVSESREVTSHYTLGGNAEVPKVTIPGLVSGRTLSVKALAFWGKSIIGQFSSDVSQFMYSLGDQVFPFDVVVTKEKASDKTQTYSITYLDCLVNNWSYNQDISKGGDVVIVESATLTFRDISAAMGQ